LKTLLRLFICLAFLSEAQAQDSTATTAPPLRTRSTEKQSFDWDKVYTGGDFGLQFGTNTFVQVAPLIGYHITDELSAGLTAKYIYYSINDPSINYNFHSNIYGGGFFTRYNILEDVFLHAEYETLSREVPFTPYENRRRLVSGCFLGGGYRQWIGEYSSINLMLLYDVIEDQYSPYQNPIIRVGFDFGL
jgi:hypothetical protein